MKAGGFEWDRGNWPKCGKHGVSRNEIEFVLSNDPVVLPDRSPVTAEARFNAVGITEGGKYLFVVFTLRRSGEEMRLRPISARYMHRKEINRYEQS